MTVTNILRTVLYLVGLCDHAYTRRERIKGRGERAPSLHLVCNDCEKDLGPAIARTSKETKAAMTQAAVLGHAGRAKRVPKEDAGAVVKISSGSRYR